MVEHEAAVIHTGQAALVLAVRRRHTGQIVAFVIADRHQDAMHAVIDRLAVFGGDELRENRRDARALGGPADVVLAGGRGLGVHDEFFGVDVVRRGRLQRLNVAAVSRLCHCETPEHLEVDDLLHVSLVVAFGAEVFDGATEQAPLHPGLDHQRQIRHREHLDHRDGGADVAGAPVLLVESLVGDARGGDELHLLGHLGAGQNRVRRVVRAELFTRQPFPRLVLHLAPTPVQRVAQIFGSTFRFWRHNSTVSPRWRGLKQQRDVNRGVAGV